MNIAFPALLITLLILPGVIFRYSYNRGTWSKSPDNFTSFTNEIGAGVVWAFVLHFLWISLLKCFGIHVHYQILLVLLIGNFGKDDILLQHTIAAIAHNSFQIALYFLLLYGASYLLGLLLYTLIRRLKWDRKFQILRFKNDWWYLFKEGVPTAASGKDRDEEISGVILSAVVNQADASYLYRGIVDEWYFDADGNLDRILLISAERRLLSDDRAKEHDHKQIGDSRYYAIIGDYLMLKYTDMQTLSVEYISVKTEPTILANNETTPTEESK